MNEMNPIIVGQPTLLQQGKDVAGNLASRSVQVLQHGVDGGDRLFKNTNGYFKSLKFIDAMLLVAQVFGGCIGGTVDVVKGSVVNVIGLIGATQVVDRTNVFVSGKYKALNTAKAISVACLVGSKACQTAKWLGNKGVINLQNIASSMGRMPVFGLLTKTSLSAVKNTFGVFACIFSLIDITQAITKIGGDQSVSRPWLSVAYEVGKIGCITLSPWALTPGYALLALATCTFGVSKYLCNEYGQGPVASKLEPAMKMTG